MSFFERRSPIQEVGFNRKSTAMRIFEMYLKGMEIISAEELRKIKGRNEEVDIYMSEGLDDEGYLEYNIHFDVLRRYSRETLDRISKT